MGLLGRQLGNQFSNEEILRGNIIPEFYGIRVRMGVHTSPVNKIDRHPVTNRVVYPNEFVRHTTMISDTACGGQVVISAQTLAETEPDASESWCVLHLGAHILEKPQTEEEKAVVRAIRIRHNVEEVQAPHDSDHADGRDNDAAE